MALCNLYFIVEVTNPKLGVRWLHHLYDAGQLLFIGALVGCTTLIWQRFSTGKRWQRVAAFLLALAASLVPAVLFVRSDFAGFLLQRISNEDVASGASYVVASLVATTPLLSWAVASKLARGWLRCLPFLLGLALQLANNVLLSADYRGLHIFAALNAASLIAAALSELKLPGVLGRLPRATRFAPPFVLLASAPAVFIQPSNLVRQQLARVEGAVLVPPLARFGWGVSHGTAKVPPELQPWFENRDNLDPIAPSKPPVVSAKDLIVIMIGVDSMRADLFDKPANKKHMPRLFELRERSVDFALTRSPGARTITTWSAVFTGRYFSGVQWSGDGNHLSIKADKQLRFPALVGKAGVTMATFTAYGALDKKALAKDFQEGTKVPPRDGQQFGLSTEAMPMLLERLAKHDDGPLLLWTHLMDAHYPYDSVKTSGGVKERFLAEMGQVDAAIGALDDAIEANGLRDRTMVIVVADHGEGFGEHGTKYHTMNVYEELIRVPLFISGPGIKPRRVTEPTTLVDLGPTLLDLYGVPTPSRFLGQSLVPFLRGENPKLTRPIAAERQGTRTLVLGDTKVIVDSSRGREEIYDLAADPEEAVNLADSLGAEGQNLLALVELFFDTHQSPLYRPVP